MRIGAATAGLGALWLCIAPGAAAAEEAAPVGAHRDAVPGDVHWSGRDIYARVLENRFRSLVQDAVMTSADRSGNRQVTRLQMTWQDFRDADGEPSESGVLSKALVKYSHPFDLRHTGYLVIYNEGRLSDQFVYLPNRRKVLRVNLRSEAVFGTDFSVEDILPGEIQDASYRRLQDEVLDGRAVFVVEAIPTELATSEYSRFLVYVDKARFVPLRTRYWDAAGVEVKELRAETDSVTEFDGVWVPLKITMRHLILGSSTTLEIDNVQANPELPRVTFAPERLEAH